MSEWVINCSAPHYNLGARKCFEWRKSENPDVQYSDGDPCLFIGYKDRLWLSVIFSWHAPVAVDIAMRHKESEIDCGGPGMFALSNYWKSETGRECHKGLDARFERRGDGYKMTFASRGCPVGCYFCIVPKLEGKTFTLDWEFKPAPILCDNNLSALPVDFQEHILKRYSESGVKLSDANSGFEPITFDEGTYARWKPQLKGPWRFAFDMTKEEPQVYRMMQILKDESPSRKRVYVLIGNEPIADCLLRAQKVIQWGGEPYCQPMMPLNALSRDDISVRYDWTKQKLKDVARYYNRFLWRKIPLSDYKPRVSEPAFSV